ncbi:hypothetical protein FVR03_20085 [Pontibacter qinzhouensis]|uniref:DUF5703 domain-containing protein n=2 Tax=Pontibacter qinzhouensis TaxID=2603253 RepID=A0A5C8J4I5_9BACT|nr:hypothetical protein FVR03_20085 [Pontibacter qinzhouensis]
MLFLAAVSAFAQTPDLTSYNIVWNSQSKNASESMPCGGGDIGLNVWVENGELLFYMSRSGAFEENNIFPKFGRVRVKLSPNPFEDGTSFRQELKLQQGLVEIAGTKGKHTATITAWVDVFRPVIHIDVASNQPVQATATYESWRTKDRELLQGEKFSSSLKWIKTPATSYKDIIDFTGNEVLFYHRNQDSTIFDLTVASQGLDSVKHQLLNPLRHLTFGGRMRGTNMLPAGKTQGTYLNTPFEGWKLQSKSAQRTHKLEVLLHIAQAESQLAWQAGLNKLAKEARAAERTAFRRSQDWWKGFWQRSYVLINPNQPDAAAAPWQVGRNYQLFRYQLACNAFGSYPTKFNGGLFTVDPVFIDSTKYPFTPDYRNWGGGTFTAQNQRLVYWPMLKSGDFDMMPPQFDFYRRLLPTAEKRTSSYWGHRGASFTEQIENFGLPNYAEYGLKRPHGFDPGVEYNAWLEYHWDTSLDFCLMILDLQRYTGKDISQYMSLIESCVVFFDEHYQYRAGMRGAKKLDENGHLVLYPGTAAETFKMAYNAASTVAGLKTVLGRMLELPQEYASAEARVQWEEMLKRVPPLSFRDMQGHKTIAPAKSWERMQNTEIPQLYPVFPFGMYGIGKPDLEVAINTWKYDTDAIKNRNYTSWHQDNIFCARLGLTEEAAAITVQKLQDADRRFPTFWGPGHDWVPDHNWGGSGMVGLQEMLLQADGNKIYLFPAWPQTWNVTFKLHAPYNTTVEGKLVNGKVQGLKVTPKHREKDITYMNFR